MGCHFLLQCRKVKSESEVAQSCPTLRDPMDCSLPGSSIHGVFLARVLEWGAIAFSVIIGDWNAKVRSQEIPGTTSKFGLGVQNEAGQRLIEFCQEDTLVITNTLFQQHKRLFTHGHHQMVTIKIRLIIFLAAEDGEALYNQQKQDWELTVAQTMNSLLPNSD